MIHLECSHCGQSFHVADPSTGQKVPCPRCGEINQVPVLIVSNGHEMPQVGIESSTLNSAVAVESNTKTLSVLGVPAPPPLFPSNAVQSILEAATPAQTADEIGRLGDTAFWTF